MAFIRISNSFVRYGLFLFAAVFLYALVLSHEVAAQDTANPITHHEGSDLPLDASARQPIMRTKDQSGCPKVPGVPEMAVFRSLKSINLYIDIPPRYREAFDCHGKEQQCIQHRARGRPRFDSEKYMRVLKERYESFPKLLAPDALVSLVRQNLSNLESFVQRTEACVVPALNVLDHEHVSHAVEVPGALTITLKVELPEDISPRLAIISAYLYRPECGASTYDNPRVSITAIPLNLSDAEVNNRLTQLVSKLPFSHVSVYQDIR